MTETCKFRPAPSVQGRVCKHDIAPSSACSIEMGEGQRSPPVKPSGFTAPALSMQERARSHGIAPSHLVPPTPSGRGRAGNDVSRFVDAPTFVQAGKSAATRHCAATPYPARSVQVRQGQRSTAPCYPFSPRSLHPHREVHAHMTLRRPTSPHPRHRSGEGQHSQAVELSGFTTPALSVQGRARSHDVVPYASSCLPRSRGQGNVHRLLHRHTSPHPLRPREEGHGSPRRPAYSKPASSARALRKFYSTFLPGFACLIR